MTTPASSLTIEIFTFQPLVALQLAAHAAAGAALLFLNLSSWWLLIGLLAVVGHGIYVWCSTLWLRTLHLLRYIDGRYQLVLRDGSELTAEGTGYFVTPILTVLRLRVHGRWRWLPLFGGSCDRDGLRRLRVFLRCRPPAPQK